MEAATLLTLTSAMGLRGGTVAGVVVNRTRSEAITKADLDLGEGNSVRVAVRAVELLLKEGA
jgi:uridine phosphorylase